MSLRTLVLCFDGTANEYNGDNTNVIKFFSLLKKDSERQLVYYQAGTGTFFSPGVVSPMFEWCAKILDEAFAWYLDAHVMDGYRFLMENYQIGDKICLFGFSRGAYTARALAGMLYKVGLIGKDNEEQVVFAYKLYKRTDAAGIALSSGFKQTFSQDVKIDFVGVWDTVGSVGVVLGRSLPFVDSNTAIKTFRHALSLDECRARFRPNLYHRSVTDTAAPCATTTLKSQQKQKLQKYIFSRFKGRQRHELLANNEESVKASAAKSEDETPTDVLEVWFCGWHADVGGGAVADTVTHSLSGISLRWMVREAMATQCGILFDEEELARISIPTTVMFPSSPSEADDDRVDIGQPMHDQLKLRPAWWILEIMPLQYTWQDANGVWHTTYSWHLGRGRVIRDPHPKFHVTVRERVNTAPLKYTPSAQWTKGSEIYVL